MKTPEKLEPGKGRGMKEGKGKFRKCTYCKRICHQKNTCPNMKTPDKEKYYKKEDKTFLVKNELRYQRQNTRDWRMV